MKVPPQHVTFSTLVMILRLLVVEYFLPDVHDRIGEEPIETWGEQDSHEHFALAAW